MTTADIPHLRAWTRPVDATEPLLDLVPADVPADEVFSWIRSGEGLVGWGRVAGIRTRGGSRFTDAERWWRATTAAAEVVDEVGLVGTGPVAFGSFAYAADSGEESVLDVPRYLVGRREGRTFLTVVTVADQAWPEDPILVAAPGPRRPGRIGYADGALPAPVWESAVAEAVRRITSGGLDKVVLARDLLAEAEEDIDPRHLLRALGRSYERTWVFAVSGLVGATPEMLVRLEKGLVTSRVLAGTIRRTGDEAKDLASAASLAHSSKDLEEHEYAVASVAEVIARFSASVNVPESPFVLHLPNVLHLATDVAGHLTSGTSSLELAGQLHPSAAVCGTPKPQADAVITELEHMDRGRYAGPVGWIDASGDGEWGIALRCGRIDLDDPARIRLFAGCGIVAGSDPASELAESDAKLLPMQTALDAVL